MVAPITRQNLPHLPRKVLRKGRIFNATLWCVLLDQEWVVKDFTASPWFCRWTFGRLAIRHEYKVLCRLQGLDGVPRDPFRLDAWALGYRYVPGMSLRMLDDRPFGGDFFRQLEQIAEHIHARGIVHLDLRNSRNVLVDATGRPCVIDFQSAAFTHGLPGPVRRILERIDRSGVYKHWLLHDAGSLGASREAVLFWQLRIRRWWPLRGYKLPGKRELYDHEVDLLRRWSPGKSRGDSDASQ